MWSHLWLKDYRSSYIFLDTDVHHGIRNDQFPWGLHVTMPVELTPVATARLDKGYADDARVALPRCCISNAI